MNDPIELILDFKVKVMYRGEVTSKFNMAKSVVPTHPVTVEVEDENDELVGELDIELLDVTVST